MSHWHHRGNSATDFRLIETADQARELADPREAATQIPPDSQQRRRRSTTIIWEWEWDQPPPTKDGRTGDPVTAPELPKQGVRGHMHTLAEGGRWPRLSSAHKRWWDGALPVEAHVFLTGSFIWGLAGHKEPPNQHRDQRRDAIGTNEWSGGGHAQVGVGIALGVWRWLVACAAGVPDRFAERQRTQRASGRQRRPRIVGWWRRPGTKGDLPTAIAGQEAAHEPEASAASSDALGGGRAALLAAERPERVGSLLSKLYSRAGPGSRSGHFRGSQQAS
ncbi:uncharacterized protein BJ171DRAFT_474849 [Polychytrium aggregatum]|uniref:uncharacterized protein n=1 Tax=Polychytrium aggregatum TaxID=110093 RepID=UPI0022FE01A9|nr:uncharacterized protein BJ171DRAFT_474849 [Polychytrium aggregatum]KAI9204616.1 hypothetical protein BJ171DRAFT_474849 [Polychytrium aggregatum]